MHRWWRLRSPAVHALCSANRAPYCNYFHSHSRIHEGLCLPMGRSFLQPFSHLLARPAHHSSSGLGLRSSLFPFEMNQVREFSSKERKRTKVTPVTSKLKKTKMKAYSSYKSRFRTMNDGSIRRWREGKRHNAHSKSKKSKRRLRSPALVHKAYAKVMKKLNFCG